jgi:drug/metabolite transporter (DMT)-like permease
MTAPAGAPDHRGRTLGLLLAVVSASCFGMMPVLTRVVYEDGADPVGVLAVRFALAAVVLLALARVRREVLPRGRPLLALCVLGGVGYVGMSLCFFLALDRIPAGLCTLLLYFYPAVVVALGALLLGERPRAAVVTCVVAATAGTALTIGPVGGSGRLTGVLLALGAALFYAGFILAGSRITGVGPLATTAVVLSAGTVVLGALALVTQPQLPSRPSAWLALLGVALIGTVVAVTAFFAALALLGASDTAIVSTVEPVVSVGLAALVLGERLSPVQLLGGLAVLVAVGTLARLAPPADEPAAAVPA